jgi:MSHA pilin protein MshC
MTKYLLCRQRLKVAQQGFTLIELIMVVVILGVLAVFAAPQMINSGDFYARGFHDETMGMLRYAQKMAIAQRRTVCAALTQANAQSATMARLTLTISSTADSASCDLVVTGPTGGPAVIEARSSVDFDASASFNFNGLGQASAAQSIQITNSSVVAGNPIVVEAETGYVHD